MVRSNVTDRNIERVKYEYFTAILCAGNEWFELVYGFPRP